jgi:hypothetical protein
VHCHEGLKAPRYLVLEYQQRRMDLWEAIHSPKETERIARAKPLTFAA